MDDIKADESTRLLFPQQKTNEKEAKLSFPADKSPRLYLPKYYRKLKRAEKTATIRNHVKALVVQLYHSLLLTLIGSFFCTSILIWVSITTLLSIPLIGLFIPLWAGHILSIGIFFRLFQKMSSVCQGNIPGSKSEQKEQTTVRIGPELLPFIQSFLVVGSRLMFGTTMLGCSEVFLYCRLEGWGNYSYVTVSSPLLAVSLYSFLQGVMCRGQAVVATISWLLVFIGLLGVDLTLDDALPPQMKGLVTFTPFWLLLIIFICTFGRLLLFHSLGAIYLTHTQRFAANGYLIGFILAAVAGNMFASCGYGVYCTHSDILVMGVLTLLAEICFFTSVYQITRQEVHFSVSRESKRSVPLPLCRSSGEWDLDRTQGHFSVVLIGNVRYDVSKSSLYNHTLTRTLLMYFCCGHGFQLHDFEGSERTDSGLI